MRTIRLGLLLFVAIAALPLIAQCVECNEYFNEGYACESTFYDGFNECELLNGGDQCMFSDPCDGILGERCSPENPDSCVIHRADLLDARELRREWQLVAVKVEGPKRTGRS